LLAEVSLDGVTISNENNVGDLSALRADFGDAGRSKEKDDSAVPASGGADEI